MMSSIRATSRPSESIFGLSKDGSEHRSLELKGKAVKLQLWDTAGQ